MPARVKICGITTTADAIVAATAGAHAIGLVFWSLSPRAVDIETAAKITAALPPFVTAVGLFFDANQAQVNHVLDHVALDLLQFHGSEPASFCDAFDRPYIKAIGMRNNPAWQVAVNQYPRARGLLLDGHPPGAAGGGGQTFNWSESIGDLGKPWILAGGLNPSNVANAIATLKPYAVDVSSGVESKPGQKDPAKIRHFIAEVQRVDHQ